MSPPRGGGWARVILHDVLETGVTDRLSCLCGEGALRIRGLLGHGCSHTFFHFSVPLQIRVIDFYAVLGPRWDMHNKGDINHYCFSPPLWSPFWKLLTAAILGTPTAGISSSAV